MRVQFVPFPAPSHYCLMVPLAWAFQNAGHDVRVVTAPNVVDTVTGTGLAVESYGEPADLSLDIGAMTWLSRISGIDSGGTAHDDELRSLILGPFVMHYGSDALRETMAELIDKTRSWRPDLVVWDTFASQTMVAARLAGAASARLLWGHDPFGRMRGAFNRRKARDGVEDSMEILLSRMLAKYDAPFDERVVVGDFSINPLPMLDTGSTEPTVALRQLAYSHTTQTPSWLYEPLTRPRVCLTLGRSVRDIRDNDNYGIAVEDLFEAVTDLDLDVVATLTAGQVPDGVKVPDNVRLVDYVPIHTLMSTCSATIHHSGGTTMMAALWHKVPQVIIPPQKWGDPLLARKAADQGGAIVIPLDELTPGGLREALLRVLDEPSFAEGMSRMHAATLTLPSPNDAVPILERLTTEAIASRS
ncbi:nucleotide disphospho-sugar-binding domain-containing protein [Actinophytocola xinjiangensis]|nr:nucleotide disphospho-sugar-binding domain-containing protein [Actinophytocola xinjiangensis]